MLDYCNECDESLSSVGLILFWNRLDSNIVFHGFILKIQIRMSFLMSEML